MDLAYWGFSRWPFQRRQSVDGPDIGQSYHEASARLMFLVEERRRCGLLTGASGTGKTRLLQQIKSFARRQGRVCLEIAPAGIPSEELAWHIASQLTDIPAEATVSRCWWSIRERLASLALVRQSAVVLVDSVDRVERGCEQVLHQLMNLAESQGTSVTVLLASRDPIATGKLRDQSELSVELTEWSFADTSRFVRESLRAAGAGTEIFTAAALEAVHAVSGGIAGEVIRNCDLTLLAAMGDDLRRIDESVVDKVASELSPSGPRCTVVVGNF